jgi:hypothetical protein
MRAVRRWLFVAALAAACAWIYAVAGSAANLLALFDAVDDARAVARVAPDQAPPSSPAAQEPPAPRVSADAAPPSAESDVDQLPQQLATDGNLSGAQIMRLLEDEIASGTDPAAADELLRAFGESRDSRE